MRFVTIVRWQVAANEGVARESVARSEHVRGSGKPLSSWSEPRVVYQDAPRSLQPLESAQV